MQVEGKGKVALETGCGNVKLLYDVYFVPNLSNNLLSVGQLMSSGYSVLFEDGACVIRDKKSGQLVVNVSMAENKMFPLEVSNFNHYALVASKKSESTLWHLRYGHLNVKGLKLLSCKEMVHGLPKIESLELCEGCIYGKQSKHPFPVGKSWRASKILELVHADLCGPMRTKSFGGSQYFLLFTDDYSRMSWVYFQQLKSETFDNFRKFKAYVEKQNGKPLKALRTDRGGEFLSNQFSLFCEENGIRREFTAPYTPEQNGVAERKNRTVVEMARSMLKAKGLPNDFWAEGVATAVYLLNLSPTKAVQNQIPYEAWSGFKPWVSHLRIFGCIAYALVNSENRSKLDDKSIKCIFVGYCTHSKAYRLYNPLNGKVVVSRNVVFDEEASWDWNNNGDAAETCIPTPLEAEIEINNGVPAITSNSSELSTPATSPQRQSSSPPTQPITESSSEESPPRKFRSLREIYANTQALFVAEPTSFEEASEKGEWIEAMKEELSAIKKNQTWELVDLPEGKQAIGLKWIFKTKYHADGSIERHKARLVAKGYAQTYGIDYEDTFSPVARFETVRSFLAFAAHMKLPVFQFDVKSAFLNGELLEEVYVSQPEGFIINGKEEKVYKLKKALYGLKQAPKAWYNKIDTHFCSNGYVRSENEPTLYLKKEGTDFLMICLYVDDIIYMGSSSALINKFKAGMMKMFEMTDLGKLHYFLGLEVL